MLVAEAEQVRNNLVSFQSLAMVPSAYSVWMKMFQSTPQRGNGTNPSQLLFGGRTAAKGATRIVRNRETITRSGTLA